MEPQVEERPHILGPELSQPEIDRICFPLTQHAAQVRYMRETLRLQVERKPGGAPLVWRAHVEAVKGAGMAGRKPPPVASNMEPDTGALQARLAAKQAARKRNG